MTKAEFLKLNPQFNPKSWYIADYCKRINNIGKLSPAAVSKQDQSYRAWYEAKHGKAMPNQTEATAETPEQPTANFFFDEIRPKYWAKLSKKFHKYKMQYAITATQTIDGKHCVTGWAQHA